MSDKATATLVSGFIAMAIITTLSFILIPLGANFGIVMYAGLYVANLLLGVLFSVYAITLGREKFSGQKMYFYLLLGLFPVLAAVWFAVDWLLRMIKDVKEAKELGTRFVVFLTTKDTNDG